jgi:autotransporter-associated beta strand protein
MKSKTTLRPYLHALTGIAFTLCAAATANAQELITNGNFTDGLTGWSTSTFGVETPAGDFGINANGPTDTSAASGDYAYAGGSTYNLLMQDVTVTTGNAYRLTFLAGSKSTQGNANGFLSLRQGALTNYNSASFDYNPSAAVFGSYTVDFVADTTTIGVWLRSDNTYAAYDNVSVTPIASVANALNYSSASGYSEISSALTGSGKVTSNAGTGGLTLSGANTHTGGTEVNGGTLFVTGAGTLGDASGNVTVSGGGILDLRNQQTRTGTISMTYQDARILSGDSTGSIVNNGGAFQFGGGLLNVPLSGSGGLNVTGGGSIDSSNSYTGATTISDTTGWYGQNQLFVNNANALGAASGDLTISGGYVNLQTNTITRSGNLTISGGSLENGTVSKSGSDYNIQGGSVGAVLAGTAGLTKSGLGTAALGGANTYTGATAVNLGTLALVGTSQASPITVSSGAALGFTLGSPTTSSSTCTFSGATAKVTVTGTPAAATLMTATSITGTPVLDPAIPGYVLAIEDGGTTLKLKSSGTTFAAWQSANSTTGAIDADHDNDGVPNGVEYFLMGATNSTGFTALPPVDNSSGTLSVTWTKAAGYTGSYGTGFRVETSTTLANPWTPATVGVGPGFVEIIGNNVKYTFPTGPVRSFARLVVTGP